jgi:hypothetical protein
MVSVTIAPRRAAVWRLRPSILARRAASSSRWRASAARLVRACLSGQAVRRRGGSAAGPDRPAGPPALAKNGRQRTQQVGQPPGRDNADPVGPQQAPGDAGAVNGDHGSDLDVGDAEDLVGLVSLPQRLVQGRDQQVAAVPDHPVAVHS